MRTCKIACSAILLFSFFLFNQAFGADVAKIGIVDFQRILDTSSAGKSARAEITKQGKQMEAELKKKGAEIEERRKKFDQEALVMKKDIRDQKERELRISINDIKVLQKKYMDDFKKFENRWVGRIQDEVIDIIEEVGKSEGYLLIVEKRGGGILYAPTTIDMTDKVIRKYNAQFAKKMSRENKEKKK